MTIGTVTKPAVNDSTGQVDWTLPANPDNFASLYYQVYRVGTADPIAQTQDLTYTATDHTAGDQYQVQASTWGGYATSGTKSAASDIAGYAITVQPFGSEVSISSVQADWGTDVATTGILSYSLSSDMSGAIEALPYSSTLQTSHSVIFPGTEGGTLAAGTTYYVQIEANDAAGSTIEDITFVGSFSDEATGTVDTTVTLPAGIQDDDYAVIYAKADASGAAPALTLNATGWTEQYNVKVTTGRPSQENIWTKVISSSETDPILQIDVSQQRSVSVHVFRDVDTTTSLDAAMQILHGQDDTTPVNPAITTVTDKAALVLIHGATNDDLVTAGLPATPTGLVMGESIVGTSLTERHQAVAYKLNAGNAGTYTPTAWTHTDSAPNPADYRCYTIALRPKTTAGGGGEIVYSQIIAIQTEPAQGLSYDIQPYASIIGQNALTIQWTTSLPTKGELRYSTNANTSGYITRTPTQDSFNYSNHLQALPNTEGGTLTADTTYYIQVFAESDGGSTLLSNIVPITTAAATGFTFTVQPNQSASTTGSVTVDWATSEGTKARLRYGTDETLSNYTIRTPTQESLTFSSHSQTFPDTEGGTLTENTNYYVQVEGEDTAANIKLSDIVQVSTASAASGSWSFTELETAPQGATWTIRSSSDTGFVDSNWPSRTSKNTSQQINTNGRKLIDRVAYDSPDTMPAFHHIVKLNDEVHPLGIDSDYIDLDFTTFTKVLLRYHCYITKHSGHAGKFINLAIGRGWIGPGYAFDTTGTWGTDGSSSNSMHPDKSDTTNYLRLLAAYETQSSSYGDNITGNNTDMPLNQWVTVDIIIDKNNGHYLYEDGVLKASKTSINPMQTTNGWNACKRLWYRQRHMHGGTPANLKAYWDYDEYFGGFFLATAP